MGNLSAAVPPTNPFEPTAPRSLEETGLHLLFLADLALKILYNTGSLTGLQMADRLKLPFNGCVDQVMEHLKRELMVEVRGGGGGFGEQGYQYTIAAKGREKAHEALERSQYAGPAPVPLVRYIEAMHRQSLKSFRVTQQEMRQALSHMVLNERVMSQIGPAVNSGRSIFLYGPPGDGKTTIAEAVGRMILTTDLLVPLRDRSGWHGHQNLRRGQSPALRDADRVNQEPRSALGEDSTPGHHDGRRTDAGDAGSGVGRCAQVLRSAVSDEGQRRHVLDRRLRAAAGAPARSAQPLDRAAGKARRLFDAAHRPQDRDSLRRADRVLDQPRAARPGGRGVPAPHPPQDRDRRSQLRRVCARFSSEWRPPRRCSTTSGRWAT